MVTPIDPDFMKKLQKTAKGPNDSYDIWGTFTPPQKLGIHGTAVAVDFDLCVGDGACIDACPVNVFEWVEYPGNAASAKKAAPIREKDCIFCTACESVCPVLAIKITQP